MSKTSIEWTEHTWNPIIGCSKVSAGCKNCYTEKLAHRFSKQKGAFDGVTDEKGHWTGVINFNEKALLAPLKRKTPTIYFVNSMSDLFHPNVSFEWIDKIMAVIALCPHHKFQVLTKHPERMKAYFDRLLRQKPTLLKCDDNDDISGITYFRDNLSAKFRVCPIGSDGLTHFITPDNPTNAVYLITTPFMDIYNAMNAVKKEHHSKYIALSKEISEGRLQQTTTFNLPLPNLWLGVSVENQETAGKRVPILLDIPAKVRFLSCEPLLENINFDYQIEFENTGFYDPDYQIGNYLTGKIHISKYNTRSENDFATYQTNKIDWVIVGGESGHNARQMHPDWVRSIKNQCESANVPFFFKQWGEYNELGEKVGKHNAGALLDGIEYKEMPNG